MPEGSVYVGRPTRWGNPFTVTRERDSVEGVYVWFVDDSRASGLAVESYGQGLHHAPQHEAHYAATRHFRDWMAAPEQSVLRSSAQKVLAGRDLACWCPLDLPCHADVLLELVNAPEATP